MTDPSTPRQDVIDALNILESRAALAGASGLVTVFDDLDVARLRREVAEAPDHLTVQACVGRAVQDAELRAQALAAAEWPDTVDPLTGTVSPRDGERQQRVAELLAPLLAIAQITGAAEEDDHTYEREVYEPGPYEVPWDPEWPDDAYDGPPEAGY